MTKPYTLPGHHWVDEPDLLFHPDRQQDRTPHPLLGLLHFGPYSRSLLKAVIDPIRVATIFPAGFKGRVRALFREFEQNHYARHRKNSLIEYPGFNRVFELRLLLAAYDH